MCARRRRPREDRVYRIAVGGANLALAAMLLYGLARYFDLIVPRYGHRFFYVAVVLAGIAIVWYPIKRAFRKGAKPPGETGPDDRTEE